MSRIAKRYLVYCAMFCAASLLFALLYYFKVIKNLSLMLTVVYVGYFVGLALLFNAVYCKKRQHIISSVLNVLLGLMFLIGAIVLLVIGLKNGQIQF